MKHLRGIAVALLASGLLQGCVFMVDQSTRQWPRAEGRIDFSDPILNQRRIWVTGTITEAVAEETIRQLLYLDAQSDQPIDLYLMTPGGEFEAAFAVERTMRLMRSRINTWALGQCNSGGAMLLAAGTGERKAFPDSKIVIHGIKGGSSLPAQARELSQASYTAFWRRKARLPDSWLPIPRGKIHVLTAEQALNYGIIDKIVAAPDSEPQTRNAKR